MNQHQASNTILTKVKTGFRVGAFFNDWVQRCRVGCISYLLGALGFYWVHDYIIGCKVLTLGASDIHVDEIRERRIYDKCT